MRLAFAWSCGSAVCLQRQLALPIVYEGVKLDAPLRIDLLVIDEIVVKAKASEQMLPVYEAQPLTYLNLTYLKLSNRRLGYLVNFNVALIKNGIRRLAL
jgi:GxxExxY protein